MKKILTLCTALLFCAVPAFAKFDPSFIWTTLESPHFLIHYHQDGEALAKRAAIIAENVHERLAPRMKWEPEQKTHLVLVDAMDEANGNTTPLPYNEVVLYITQPVGGPGFGTTAYDEWLRVLITHEYTHVLHMDMVNGIPKAIQSVLGRIYFPNMFEPVWMIEGLATYEETSLTSGGRGRSPGADMVLRMATLEGSFPELPQAAVYPDTWPGGEVPYLFGESFTRYIAEKYGREALADISVTYSGRGFPFLVSSTGERVLHRSYDELWLEWKDHLRERYRKKELEVREKGMTVSTPLTKRGELNVSPVYSPDNTKIAYSVENRDGYPGIYVMNIDGSNDRKLIENVFPTSASGSALAWSADNNRLYYTKIEVQSNTNLYNDIYAFDLKEGREIRLTRGLRARDPHPSADGKKLVFVTNQMSKNRLAVMDLSLARQLPATQQDITWLGEQTENQFAVPRWSPDTTKLAVSVKQPGGFQDIWILDSAGTRLEEISHDRALDGTPAWSPDSKYIYFSSDRTGIFNLYAFECETKKAFQVTNVLGGAFTPAPSPDSRMLVFSSYSAKGYDIYTLPVYTTSWKTVEPYADPYPEITYEEKPIETRSAPYSPLPSIAPRFWFPWFGYSESSGSLYGAYTFGQDALQRHTYSFEALYGPNHERIWYALSYYYDGLYPTLHLLASDSDNMYTGLLKQGSNIGNYEERDRTIDASLILPFVKTATQHSLTFGYRHRELSSLTVVPSWLTTMHQAPAEGVFASARVGYLFNNAREYGASISPERGRTLALGYERMDKLFGSDFDIRKYTADWHEFINLPGKHQVLQARFFAGSSSGINLPQRAFQLGGDSPGDLLISTDDQVVYLRGYPVNVLRGRKAALASLEYRFPIKNLEDGWDSKPWFFRRMHGAVFAEAGDAWNLAMHGEQFKRSVGAELRFDMYLAYYVPATLRFVLVNGLDDLGQKQIYFSFWLPMGL